MNYNQQQYGAQPMVQNTLPFPPNQLLSVPVQYASGRPPILPSVSYLPQAFTQYYPFIVSACIDSIQGPCQLNPLRVFMYNQMSSNQYVNQQFTAFVEGTIKLLEFKVRQQSNIDPQQAILSAAKDYSEMIAAYNTVDYPGLLGVIDYQIAQGVQIILNNYRSISQQIQSVVSQSSGFQQPMQQNYGMQQPVMSMNRSTSGISPISVGGGSIFNNTGAPAMQMPAAPLQKSVSRYDRFLDTTPVAAKAAPVVVSQPLRLNEPVAPAMKTVMQIDSPVPWKPSAAAPFDIAYDPNTKELCYEIRPDGSIIPKLKKKEVIAMDINSHLIVPKYANVYPVAMPSLDVGVRSFQMDESLAADKLGEDTTMPTDLDAQYINKYTYTDVSLNNHWATNQGRLLLMQKKEKRVGLFRTKLSYLEPLVTLIDPLELLVHLTRETTFEGMIKILRLVENEVNSKESKLADSRILTFIDRRITRRINDYIKKELAVIASMDSFILDGLEIIGFIRDNYGINYAEALTEKQATLLLESLTIVEKHTELQSTQVDNLFSEKEKDKFISSLCFTYFYQNYTMTSIDINANELRLEIPNSKVSVGVFANETPMLRKIMEATFTYARAVPDLFTKHLVQTADGVVLEITKAAINPDFYLVCPENL